MISDVAERVWKQYEPPAKRHPTEDAFATVPCGETRGQGPWLGFEFDNLYGTFTRWVHQDAMKTYRPDIKQCVSTVIAAADEPSVLGVPFLNSQVILFDLDQQAVFFGQRTTY